METVSREDLMKTIKEIRDEIAEWKADIQQSLDDAHEVLEARKEGVKVSEEILKVFTDFKNILHTATGHFLASRISLVPSYMAIPKDEELEDSYDSLQKEFKEFELLRNKYGSVVSRLTSAHLRDLTSHLKETANDENDGD